MIHLVSFGEEPLLALALVALALVALGLAAEALKMASLQQAGTVRETITTDGMLLDGVHDDHMSVDGTVGKARKILSKMERCVAGV